jgi:putative ABC transport system permease protein
MWKILLEEFLGDLRTQKTRTLLTLLAMTWGTISVVLLLAFGDGLRIAVEDGLVNAGEDIFLLYGGETSKVFEGLPNGRRIRLTGDDLDILMQSIPELDLGSPSYGRWGTTFEYGDQKTTTYMEGIHPEFSEMRRMFPQQGGRFINAQDVKRRRRVIFFGNEIAERLFGGEDAVGKTVLLDGTPFTVVGVMQKKFQDSSNNGPDADRAIIPASTLKTTFGRQFVNHLVLRPRHPLESEYVKAEIFRVLGRRYQFDPTDQRALGLWDLIEDRKLVVQIGAGIQIFLGLVGAFTLIVAGVGVANIMYVVVRERTREIGIKLAVGARKRHIMSQFVFEALLIALVGGGVGLLLSALVVAGVNALPGENPAMQYIANPNLSWPIALTAVSILVGIGLIAGFLPARKAAGVDPVESLRYE